ncbi:MAG: hypothetical protein HYZ42_08955 [Bacteroidetes bacterium]|nr:hypothetical protein [Bacteroidota bacterium]
MKKYSILIIVYICYSIGLRAQTDPMKIITQINKTYATAKTFSTQINYAIYDAVNPNKVVNSYISSYYKSGTSYYSKTPAVESIFNDKLVIYADHQNKFISVTESANKKKIHYQEFMDMFKDTALNQYSLITIKKEDDQVSKCTFTMKPSENGFEKIELFYTHSDFHVVSVLIHYRKGYEIDSRYSLQKPIMKITYTQTMFNQPLSKSLFSVDRFLKVDKKKKVFLNPTYKNYKLLVL